MRNEFAKVILELAEKDEKIILLCADYKPRLDEFARKFPERFFNLGICEQSIVSMAAGMALEGFKPYVYSITPFLTERALEQIKLDIIMQQVNVKIVGYADYPTAGPTHHPLNTQGIANLLNEFADKFFEKKNERYIECYCPKNSEETRKILLDSYNSNKPAIISLKKEPEV